MWVVSEVELNLFISLTKCNFEAGRILCFIEFRTIQVSFQELKEFWNLDFR